MDYTKQFLEEFEDPLSWDDFASNFGTITKHSIPTGALSSSSLEGTISFNGTLMIPPTISRQSLLMSGSQNRRGRDEVNDVEVKEDENEDCFDQSTEIESQPHHRRKKTKSASLTNMDPENMTKKQKVERR